MAKKKEKAQQEKAQESNVMKKTTVSLDSIVFPPLTRKHNLTLDEIEPDKIILIPVSCHSFLMFSRLKATDDRMHLTKANANDSSSSSTVSHLS